MHRVKFYNMQKKKKKKVWTVFDYIKKTIELFTLKKLISIITYQKNVRVVE